MKIRSTTTAAIAASAASILLLAGCASGSTPNSDQAGGSAGGAFPVTVTHEFGETTVDAQPAKIAATAFGNADFLLSLGVAPVGMPAASWGDEDGDGYLPWTLEALEGLGKTPSDVKLFDEASNAADFEGIADTAPDAIFGAYAGLTQEDYTTLSEIAPTVPQLETAWFTPWRESLAAAGKLTGKETEAASLQADLEKQIADATAAGGWEGKTFAFYSYDPSDTSSIGFYTDLDTRVRFLTDLGLVIPDSIKEASAAAPGAFYTTISAENADKLDDVDIIIGYGASDTLQQLQADPLLSKIRAVENGAVVTLDSGIESKGSTIAASITPTSLSIPYVLKNVSPRIAEAAAKVK